jgi:MYXO-CTERM domain-containing protein
VYVVPTTGFKDLYEQQNGDIPQGCPCAAAGPAQVEGALPIALALGVLAYRRRRRT